MDQVRGDDPNYETNNTDNNNNGNSGFAVDEPAGQQEGHRGGKPRRRRRPNTSVSYDLTIETVNPVSDEVAESTLRRFTRRAVGVQVELLTVISGVTSALHAENQASHASGGRSGVSGGSGSYSSDGGDGGGEGNNETQRGSTFNSTVF